MTVFERTSMRNTQSALSYAYIPTTYGESGWADNESYFPERIFKGFHVNADGAVSVIGVDDVTVTFTVKSGCTYPYGGKGIDPIGTTVSIAAPANLILLF